MIQHTDNPISLYIHIPWCIRKCPYCDFNSHTLKSALPENDYVQALIADLNQKLHLVQNRTIHSIFIGGGTPSLFHAKSYEYLLNKLHLSLIIPSDTEITLEANPGTIEQKRFHDYRQLGINRLSLGVQSFQNDKLVILGRIHNRDDARRAVMVAQEVGFNNINLDLMFGLPQQTLADSIYDLQTAINLKPQHISWYQLTLEPNTYFYKFPPSLPEDDSIWEMQTQGHTLLHQNSYQHYEISAYARDHKQCCHNLNYWEFGDYIGIGAGAHSKITDLNDFSITRYWNIKHPTEYLSAQKSFIAGQKVIPNVELPLEFMLNALRLQKPLPLILLTKRTGLDPSTIEKQLNEAQQKNLLTIRNNTIHLTAQGMRFLNDVLEIFLCSSLPLHPEKRFKQR